MASSIQEASKADTTMTTSAELMTVLETALDRAGEILLHHYGKLDAIEEKNSSINLVTVADRESENAIKAVIREAFPSHEILAEESGEDFKGRQAGTRWIIDPLDGTTNFAHSFPLFATSIAVEHKGQIVAAGVANPYYKERFLAERGSGATLNGRPIHVSRARSVSESLLVTGFPYDRRERIDHYLSGWKEMLLRAHGVLRLGSAALDLCCVASGRLDGFWEEKLNPWDTAAGWLIVEEAGGRVSTHSGEPFSPYGPTILATNGAIHEECIEALRKAFKNPA